MIMICTSSTSPADTKLKRTYINEAAIQCKHFHNYTLYIVVLEQDCGNSVTAVLLLGVDIFSMNELDDQT